MAVRGDETDFYIRSRDTEIAGRTPRVFSGGKQGEPALQIGTSQSIDWLFCFSVTTAGWFFLRATASSIAFEGEPVVLKVISFPVTSVLTGLNKLCDTIRLEAHGEIARKRINLDFQS